MNRTSLPQPSAKGRINDQMNTLVKLTGDGGVIKIVGEDDQMNPLCDILTHGEACADGSLSTVMANYRKHAGALTSRSSDKLKDHLIVAFEFSNERIEPPVVMVEKAVVDEDGTVVDKELVRSTSDVFLVYQPSGCLVWKALGKLIR